MFVSFAETTKTVLSVAPKNEENVSCGYKRDQTFLRTHGERLSSNVSKSTVMNVKNDAFADQILHSIEFPHVRTERVGETKGNLETDACMLCPLANKRRHTNCGDLYSPILCRASQRSMISGNLERGHWWWEHYSESSTTCQDAQNFLNSRRKNCIVREKVESCALFTSLKRSMTKVVGAEVSRELARFTYIVLNRN